MMCHRVKAAEQDAARERDTVFIARTCHPQNIEVVRARAAALGLKVETGDWRTFEPRPDHFCAIVQYPETDGAVPDYAELAERVHAVGAMVVAAADLLSLTLLRPPGEFGADVAVGSAQRFGVPLGYGGPHAGYFATRDAFKRSMPGRLVGV